MGIFDSKTKMTKVTERGGLDIYELGDQLYYFKPKIGTNTCIITAHGGHTVLTKTNIFTVPSNTVLRFYSEDTYSVVDPGFSSFYHSVGAVKELVSEGESCFDYILTKYQGKGNNEMGETYDSIAQTINQNFNNYNFLDDRMKVADKSSSAYAKMHKSKYSHKFSSVLTVRNRMFKSDMTLSTALAEVKKIDPEILVFDCLFCRSTMFGGKQHVNLVSNTAKSQNL